VKPLCCRIFLLYGLIQTLNAQPLCTPPPIEWQRSFGGNDWDDITAVLQTEDGGYLVGGMSASEPGGTRTAPSRGHPDIWMVRLDSSGSKLWDRAYGQSVGFLEVIRPATNGGFILGATSWTEDLGPRSAPGNGGYDFTIIGVDANGDERWQQNIGGTGHDYLRALVQTADGGLILGGNSSSAPGGTIKKSENYGASDFWIVRLDPDRHILWERSFGGSDLDDLYAIVEVAGGGYLLAGYSYSPADGNKTSANLGGADGWVIRLDAGGNKLWERAYGGASWDVLTSARQTADGGFVLAGYRDAPSSDFWVLRIDAQGTPLWERSFAGPGNDRDELRELHITADGGFIVGGIAGDGAGGDFWVLRLNPQGTKMWEGYYGGTSLDNLMRFTPTADGGFLLGGYSYSGISGNKTSTNNADERFSDYWVIKLGPEQICDADQDGVPETIDECPGTLPGAVVDAHGCSIEQLVPCDAAWRNHGEYVNAIQSAAALFRTSSLITRAQEREIVRRAEQSDCGKRQRSTSHPR
jgi:hypothetical protein